MDTEAHETDALRRVHTQLDARITRHEHTSRRRRCAVVIGASVAAAASIGGAAAIGSIATPRQVDAGVACFDSLDTSGDTHEVGFGDTQSMPDAPDEKARLAVEMCALIPEGPNTAEKAVCVRPDGLWAVFPRESGQTEAEVCDLVGYRWALDGS